MKVPEREEEGLDNLIMTPEYLDGVLREAE